jgi:prepilin-type N-terminal cleavage/methylation domain-containing protein
MKRHSTASLFSPGFTILEMLVAIAVLVLMITLVAQLTGSATALITYSRKHMDADTQARQIFDRMANDFAKIVNRNDVDCLIYKENGAASGANDKLFFYSEAPGYYDSTVSGIEKSPVALVGYRIHLDPDFNNPSKQSPQLERLGKGLLWNSPSNPGGMVFLSGSAGSATPDPATTLAGHWSTVIGTEAANFDDGEDSAYHVLGEQVFRLEICFFLKDGTISPNPISNPSSTKNNLTATDPPSLSSDNLEGYTPGSRWFDCHLQQGYICISSATGAALWNRIGIQDVSAIIVAIAILDSGSKKIVAKPTLLAGAFLDADTTNPSNASNSMAPDLSLPRTTRPRLMAEAWLNTLNQGNFAKVNGLPTAAASQIRVYQRAFYLSGAK